MRILRPCILLFLILTGATGIVYPAAVTVISQLLFPYQANGSLIRIGSRVGGSALIGQNFTSPAYFWPRPSASDYSALPSAASNQGSTSAALMKAVKEREKRLSPFIPGKIPADLLLASGSGLDPHISPEAALSQVPHVARARHLSKSQEARLEGLVRQRIELPQWGIFGAPRVNVLLLNMNVDRVFGAPALIGDMSH